MQHNAKLVTKNRFLLLPALAAILSCPNVPGPLIWQGKGHQGSCRPTEGTDFNKLCLCGAPFLAPTASYSTIAPLPYHILMILSPSASHSGCLSIIKETDFFLNPLSFFCSFIVLVKMLFQLYVSPCSCLL